MAAEDDKDKSLAVEVEKDSVTTQNDTIGIAQSYVARTLVAAADDITDLVMLRTNGRKVDLLVAASGSIRADADRAVAIGLQANELLTRVSAALSTSPDEVAPPPASEEVFRSLGITATGMSALWKLAASALQVLPSAAGTLTKLIAHQYTTAGTTLAEVQGAVDLRVAGAIRSRLDTGSSLTVRIERLWTPSHSALLDRVTAMLARYAELQAALGATQSAQQRAKAALDAASAAQASAREQLVELSKSLGADTAVTECSPWQIAWAYAAERADTDLTTLVAAHDLAAAKAAELESLRAAIEAFLLGVLKPDEAGQVPLAAAMRGEWLQGSTAEAERMVLYVRELHGGVDQVLDAKVKADQRVVLAGSAVEYALVSADGTVSACGVRDNLWGGAMRLDRIDAFSGKLIDSVFEPRVSRTEPT